MDGPIAPLGIEMLLQHREWVRRVARVLVRDESAAEDLEQDLWAKAIEKPPNVRGSVRGWLAVTLKNLFLNRRRSEARRVKREEAASRPEGQPPTADVVALAEAHRRVVAAVLDLDEPYRKTVLLRFFEDLSASDIATREGVPLETVRTRLKRALAILKERFDAKEGGNRRAWQAALLPLSMPSLSVGALTGTGTAAVVGGLVVQTSTKIAIAAVVVAAAGVVGWYALKGPGPSATPDAAEAAEAASDGMSSGDAVPSAIGSGPTLAADGTPSGAFSGRTRRGAGSGEAGDESAGGPSEGTPGATPGKPFRASRTGAVVVPGGSGSPGAVKSGKPGPAGEISGRLLLLSDRTPLQGATVSLVSGELPAGKDLPESRRATTGFDGSFRLSSLPPGSWWLVASKDGYAPQGFAAKLLEENGEAGIEILLAAAGWIEGRVTDARGDPVAGLALTCEAARGMSVGPAAPPTRTDAEGAYRFPALAAGDYVVILERAAGQPQRALASVVEGKATRLDFAGGSTLRGTLTDEARAPIAGAKVRALPTSGTYVSREATTDKAGRFRLDELQPGEWKLTLQVFGPQGFATDLATTTVYPGENTLDLDLTRVDLAGEVFGRVLGAGTGAPLSASEVQVTLNAMEAKDGVWTLGRSFHMAFADKEGRFRFRAIRPGRYRFSAVPLAGALRLREEEFELSAGEKKDLHDVALEAMKVGTVKFVVKDEAGAPVVNVNFAKAHGSGSWTFEPGRPEPGTYTTQMEAGTAKVHLSRAGLAETEVVVEVKEGETVLVEVVLHPAPPPK